MGQLEGPISTSADWLECCNLHCTKNILVKTERVIHPATGFCLFVFKKSCLMQCLILWRKFPAIWRFIRRAKLKCNQFNLIMKNKSEWNELKQHVKQVFSISLQSSVVSLFQLSSNLAAPTACRQRLIHVQCTHTRHNTSTSFSNSRAPERLQVRAGDLGEVVDFTNYSVHYRSKVRQKHQESNPIMNNPRIAAVSGF